jgi:hypothetical protein
MKIITTFNDRIYSFSGRRLLKQLDEVVPLAEKVIYEDFHHSITNKRGIETENGRTINLSGLKTYREVLTANQDVILKSCGGSADSVAGDAFWNSRWFGWFCKVAAMHHAVCIDDKNLGHYLVFVDADIRFIKPLNDSILDELTKGRPITFVKGNRPAIDSGFFVVDMSSPKPEKFYGYFMDLFLSGNFKTHTRWDDGYLMTKLVEACPQEWFHDLAEGQEPKKYTNSNGHVTENQIIPFSEVKDYIEHDKGIHIRNNIA